MWWKGKYPESKPETQPPIVRPILFSRFLYAVSVKDWAIYSLHRTVWDPDNNWPIASAPTQQQAVDLMNALDPHESERINKLLSDGNPHAPLATPANTRNT